MQQRGNDLPLAGPLFVVHTDGTGPCFEYFVPASPLLPDPILLCLESLHPLLELVFQARPIIILQLDLRVHLELGGHHARMRRGRGGHVVKLELGRLVAVVAISAPLGIVRGSVERFARYSGRGAESLVGNVGRFGALVGVTGWRASTLILEVGHWPDGLSRGRERGARRFGGERRRTC